MQNPRQTNKFSYDVFFQQPSLSEWKDSRLHEVFYKSVVKQDTPLVVECLSYGADPNRHFPIVSWYIVQ